MKSKKEQTPPPPKTNKQKTKENNTKELKLKTESLCRKKSMKANIGFF